jgi:hypothetical protein
MGFVISLAMVAHATLLAIIAFFVLFAASRATGWLKALGSALGIWVLILAVIALICAVAAPFIHVAPGRGFGPGMMPGMMNGQVMMGGPGHMRWRAQDCPPATEQAPAPTTPSTTP